MAAALRRQIVRGQLKEGDALPHESVLMETFAVSLVFWLKMALIAGLLLNGFIMTWAEHSLRSADAREDDRAWTHLHHTAVASLLLWYAITLAGVALLSVS